MNESKTWLVAKRMWAKTLGAAALVSLVAAPAIAAPSQHTFDFTFTNFLATPSGLDTAPYKAFSGSVTATYDMALSDDTGIVDAFSLSAPAFSIGEVRFQMIRDLGLNFGDPPIYRIMFGKVLPQTGFFPDRINDVNHGTEDFAFVISDLSNLNAPTSFTYSRTQDLNTAHGWFSRKGTVTLGTYVPPVPEPETWAMLLAGLGLLGAAARRNRHQKG